MLAAGVRVHVLGEEGIFGHLPVPRGVVEQPHAPAAGMEDLEDGDGVPKGSSRARCAGVSPEWVSPSVQENFNHCARFVFLSRAID